jgi:hypothetical protein
MKYTVQMASDGVIFVPNFMENGWAIQVILRLLLRHSESFGVGITDGKDL